MRELDVLLESFLHQGYPQADDGQKQAFRELLSLSDPELVGYLLHGRKPRDSAIAAIVEKIRERPQT